MEDILHAKVAIFETKSSTEKKSFQNFTITFNGIESAKKKNENH